MEDVRTLVTDALVATAETDVPAAPETPSAPEVTTNAVVDLLAVLQTTLGLVDMRATTLATILLAGFIAVWTQLHTFVSGAPAALAWVGWGLLVLALLVIARVMFAHRLTKLGDSLISSSERRQHLQVLAAASVAVREEINWLRRHVTVSVALAVVALLDVVAAYAIEKA